MVTKTPPASPTSPTCCSCLYPDLTNLATHHQEWIPFLFQQTVVTTTNKHPVIRANNCLTLPSTSLAPEPYLLNTNQPRHTYHTHMNKYTHRLVSHRRKQIFKRRDSTETAPVTRPLSSLRPPPFRCNAGAMVPLAPTLLRCGVGRFWAEKSKSRRQKWLEGQYDVFFVSIFKSWLRISCLHARGSVLKQVAQHGLQV